ncbi:MAG: HAD-IIA family hydrolase [Victivallaceae bacterium]|nr:HAD-IIA family hydrolase [Victivallaceae bacterium]
MQGPLTTHLRDFYHCQKEQFDAFLVDIDGTLLCGSRALPGAPEWIAELRHDQMPFCFLSNNGSDLPEEIAARLTRAGIDARPEEIIGSVAPLARVLEEHHQLETLFFLIGNEEFCRREGIRWTKDSDRQDECGGILFLGGKHNWQESFTLLLNMLAKRPDLTLVIPNPDWLNRTERGLHLCPMGQFQMVETVLRSIGIEVHPIATSKPFAAIYDYAMTVLPSHCRRERVCCVGDLLFSDIQGAAGAGMKSILLLTGLTDRAAAEASEFQPDWIFDRM